MAQTETPVADGYYGDEDELTDGEFDISFLNEEKDSKEQDQKDKK